MWGTLVLFCSVIITVQLYPTNNSGPCKVEDKACITGILSDMLKGSIAGDPSINMMNLDPMYQDEIIGNLATIKYTMLKPRLDGLSSCNVVNASLSLKQNKVLMEFVCQYLDIGGKYDVNGLLLNILKIQGNGDFIIKTKDYKIVIDADIKINQDANGLKYMAFKTYKVTADCRGGITFNLTNLFDGNKELGDPVLQFMNMNWKAVGEQLQGPVFNANIKTVVKNFNKYLKARPLDTLVVSQ